MLVRYEILETNKALKKPQRMSAGAAGIDLRSANPRGFVLKRGRRAVVRCGFAAEIPRGYVGLICPRSGLAAKRGVTVLNAPGVIDSDYRGEISVILANFGSADFFVERGIRIAQLIVVPCWTGDLIEGELTPTERGSDGLGSTGDGGDD